MTAVMIGFALACITAYIAVMCERKGGIPSSISETYYSLEHRWWFMFTMFITAGLLIPSSLEITPDKLTILPFAACAGIGMVGTSPDYKNKEYNMIHIIGAILSLTSSQLLVGFINWKLLIPVWGCVLAYFGYKIFKSKNKGFINKLMDAKPMFWTEIAALFTTFITLLKIN